MDTSTSILLGIIIVLILVVEHHRGERYRDVKELEEKVNKLMIAVKYACDQRDRLQKQLDGDDQDQEAGL